MMQFKLSSDRFRNYVRPRKTTFGLRSQFHRLCRTQLQSPRRCQMQQQMQQWPLSLHQQQQQTLDQSRLHSYQRKEALAAPRNRVSSSPQLNRFEVLSESMDDDEELDEDKEFFPSPSQD